MRGHVFVFITWERWVQRVCHLLSSDRRLCPDEIGLPRKEKRTGHELCRIRVLLHARRNLQERLRINNQKITADDT